MSEDTIAAIATAPGEAGIAIVRLSGPHSIAIAARLAPGAPHLGTAASHTAHHAWLRGAGGRVLDEALVTLLRGPGTVTGEDVVEIGVHGGSVLARRVLRAALDAGARLADRGEFTRRAFLNGRIDLSQAEAVVDLVRARTERGADAALRTLGGGMAARTLEIEDDLLDLAARLETNLDFSEDVAPAGRAEIAALLAARERDLERLARQAAAARKLREGATVVLVGRPNVGKSSLFNALLQDDRAIVSEIPGTTRDWLEAWIDIGGIPVRLVDTAGWRTSSEAIEAEGVVRAQRLEAGADQRLVVKEAPAGETEEDRRILEAIADGSRSALIVWNKGDLGGAAASANARAPEAPSRGASGAGRPASVCVSARTGQGVEALRARIGAELESAGDGEFGEEILAGERHEDAIRRAREGARIANEAWRDGATEELVASEIRGAAMAIGEITGKCVGDDVLDRIFSRFCIGK